MIFLHCQVEGMNSNFNEYLELLLVPSEKVCHCGFRKLYIFRIVVQHNHVHERMDP